MKPFRVLVVDDSVVIRHLVSDLLAADPMIEVVGTARNGRVALRQIEALEPDLVTLDIEMPELDGLGALREIRSRWPKLPVIMFSTLTSDGAEATIKALVFGASDYVTKPSNVGSMADGVTAVRDQLLPKVKALCGWIEPTPTPAPTVRVPTRPAADPRSITPVSLLVIGTSTGGPNALGTLWPMLTAPCPVPVLLVQHMPPKFTKSLADRLSGFGTVPIAEAVDGEPLRSGRGYIAPGDHHMRLRRTTSGITLRLDHGPLENSCRPSLEPTFRSAAEYFGAGVLAVMLTGMGQDGIEGSAAIVEAGGTLIAQDKESSVVWGMPGAVVSAGLTDLVLPLDQIAPAINRRLQAAVPSVANRPYRPLVARGTS